MNGPKTGVKRNFNEAAHKLGYWPVTPAPRPRRTPARRRRSARRSDDERDVVAHASKLVLALGALGIVYGDIGTSPLYTVQMIFTQHADAARPTIAGVYGIVVADLLGADHRGLDQVRRLHHARPQPRRRRDHGAERADPAPQGAPRGGAGDARDLRRRAVLRRRDDHAGDLGHLGGRGPQGRDAEPRAPRRPDLARDPGRPVRGAAVRHRRRRLAVRAGDAGLVRRSSACSVLARSSSTRRAPGPVADLGGAVHGRSRRRRRC